MTCANVAKTGVEVEVLAPPPLAAPRIQASEDAGAMPLFQLYADHVGMTPEAVAIGSDILKVRQEPCHCWTELPHLLTCMRVPSKALALLVTGDCGCAGNLSFCSYGRCVRNTSNLRFKVECVRQDLAGGGASIHMEGATIELHSMELEGYGPYRHALDPAPI